MNVSSAVNFNNYVKKLEEVSGITVSSFDDFLYALQNRHDFFASIGCKVSDHGLEEIYADDFTGSEIDAIFTKVHSGKATERNRATQIPLSHADPFCRMGLGKRMGTAVSPGCIAQQ
jgi:glucuronate isomerase